MSNARIVAIVVVVFLLGVLLYMLAPILTPFLAAALLAYVGNPLVTLLQRYRIPRALGVTLVFLLFAGVFIGLIFYLVPVLVDSIAVFTARLPAYFDLAVAQLPRLEAWLGIKLAIDPASLRETLTGHWREVGNWTTETLGVITRSSLTVFGWLANLVLIPVVTFYLLLDWNDIVRNAADLIPSAYRQRVKALATETDKVLSSFLRGQLSVMAALATVYSVGLLFVGLDLALPIGIVSGLVSFVPYLGLIVGIVSATIAAYLQFHDVVMLLWVAAVFGIGQLLEGTVLTPRLVGNRIGLHPVAVIFAIMAGAQLFGFVGVLLALPAAAAIKVWLRHLPELWLRTPAARPRRR